MVKISLTFDGKPCQGAQGQTIAGVLMENGIRTFRHGLDGKPSGVYCGMGQCFQCRVVVNGEPNVRACKTLAKAGDVILTQNDAECGVE